jgi:hypothetical protein
MTRFLWVLGFLCVAAFAQADDAKRLALATELANANRGDFERVKDALFKGQGAENLPPAVTDDLKRILDKNINVDAISAEVAKIHAKHLTEAELQALLNFQKSTEGQAIVKKMPDITVEIAKLQQTVVRKAMQEFFESPSVQAEMKKAAEKMAKNAEAPAGVAPKADKK